MRANGRPYSRRSVMGFMIAGVATALTACDASPGSSGAEKKKTGSRPAGAGSKAIHVYRDPECGCCEAWAEIARKAGYEVTVESRADMPAIKALHGVPDELRSCHTAVAGGYAIEGHVPLKSVARLLAERPDDIRGIAVPGMPRGSPGMEMPDDSIDAYTVMAFGAAGDVRAFGA